MPPVNLGQISAIHTGSVPPQNTKMMWYDTVNSIIKYYSIQSSQWESFDGVGVFVPISGGTMTGKLTLSGPPTQNEHAATKAYVDSKVSSSQNTLSGILSSSPGSNETDGSDIVVSTGDSIKYESGAGGSIVSSVTTQSRVWTLPDSDGTLLIGTGTQGILPVWGSGGSLEDSPVKSNGVEVGINSFSSDTAFQVNTSGLKTGVSVIGSPDTGIDISIDGQSNSNRDGVLLSVKDSSTKNTGIVVEALSSSNAVSYGAIISSKGSTDKNIGVESRVSKSNSGGISISFLGVNDNITSLSQTATLIGVYGGIREGGVYDIDTDKISIRHAATTGHYTGTVASSTEKYGGVFIADIINPSSSNIGLLVSAENANDNYGLLVEKGLVGIGTLTPDKQLVISNGSGSVKIDTTQVNNGEEYSMLQGNNGMVFKSTGGYHRFLSGITQSLNILSNSRVVIGSDAKGHSHLSVVSEGGERDGSIQSLIDNPTHYSESTVQKQLVLSNKDKTVGNTSSITFETLDTNDVEVTSGGISVIHGSRVSGAVEGTLVFSSNDGISLHESMRITPSGDIGIGVQSVSDKVHIVSNTETPKGITVVQDHDESSSILKLQTKSTDGGYVGAEITVTESVVGYVSPLGQEQRYLNNSTHIVNTGTVGGINLVTGEEGVLRVFTDTDTLEDSGLLLSASKFGLGIGLQSVGITGQDLDTPKSQLHVGGGVYVQTGSEISEHVTIKSDSGVGGLILTEDSTLIDGDVGTEGYKFTASNGKLEIFDIEASAPNTPANKYITLSGGNVGVGGIVDISERLTVDGAVALSELSLNTPTPTTGQGKVYIKSDKKLYYLDSTGQEYNLLLSSGGGGGVELDKDESGYSIFLKDGYGSVISQLDVEWLGKEGKSLVYSPSLETIELRDRGGDVLSSLPLSSLPLIQDSPYGGKQYARKDGTWEEIQVVAGETPAIGFQEGDSVVVDEHGKIVPKQGGWLTCEDLENCQEIVDIKDSIPTDVSELSDTDSILFSGDYNDLDNKPTIPTNNSELVNDSDFISELHADGRYIRTTQKGSNNGVAELDNSGKVPVSQLPSYVSDVEVYNTLSSFPAVGEDGVIYIAEDTNLTYRWTGSTYVEISPSIALGETSSTAYRGDRGKIAYDHSQLTSGNPHNVNKSDVGLSNVDNTSDADKPISTATQGALNSKVESVTGTGVDNTDPINPVISIDKHTIRLGNVDNTSDLSKPISTATQTALNGKVSSVTGRPGVPVDNTDPLNPVIGLQDRLPIEDTRADNEDPLWYFNNFPSKTIYELKHIPTMGLSSIFTSGSFCTVETINQWENSTGGYPFQIATNPADGKMAKRYGVSDTTWSNWVEIGAVKVDKTQSTAVGFTSPTIYGTHLVPLPTISEITSNRREGIVQKIYMQNSTIPTFPAGWVKLGGGMFSTTELNIVFAEYCGGHRVEYWIVQEN